LRGWLPNPASLSTHPLHCVRQVVPCAVPTRKRARGGSDEMVASPYGYEKRCVSLSLEETEFWLTGGISDSAPIKALLGDPSTSLYTTATPGHRWHVPVCTDGSSILNF
jgi:hypothetical protein